MCMPMEFIASHPFLFTIKDKRSGSALFFGRVGRPSCWGRCCGLNWSGLTEAERQSGLDTPLQYTNYAISFSASDKYKYLSLWLQVLHKAFIEVNEEGTEAAAATGMQMMLMCMPMEFIASHPFLFAIKDKRSGSALFFGRVGRPSCWCGLCGLNWSGLTGTERQSELILLTEPELGDWEGSLVEGLGSKEYCHIRFGCWKRVVTVYGF